MVYDIFIIFSEKFVIIFQKIRYYFRIPLLQNIQSRITADAAAEAGKNIKCFVTYFILFQYE